MDITRNQFFLAGLVLLLLGLQFRAVDTLTLTPEFTEFLANQTNHPAAKINSSTQAIFPTQKPILKKTVRPPDWIGWSLLSIAAVLILHSMAMRQPEKK